MTLIARLSVRNAPFVVGDVLLSGERGSGLRADLPLVGDINQILASRGLSFEVSFAQKVNILSDRLVVAWAGPMEQARRALNVLSAISSCQDLTKDKIKDEINAIDPDRIDKLQLIGMIVTEVRGATITASKFSLRVSPTDVPGLGPVHAAGTGKEDFIRLLGKTDWTCGGVANELEAAHFLVGSLVNMEYRQGGTIENRWGGGFEAVTFASDIGRFQKVGNVLHTFWSVDLRLPDKAQFIPWFYKTMYWQDALVIRYARFDAAGEGGKLVMNRFELIPPLLKDAHKYNPEGLGDVDFSHSVLSCHVSVARPGGHGVMHTIERSKPGETIELEFRKRDSSVRLHIPGSLSRKIIEQVRIRASRPVQNKLRG